MKTTKRWRYIFGAFFVAAVSIFSIISELNARPYAAIVKPDGGGAPPDACASTIAWSVVKIEMCKDEYKVTSGNVTCSGKYTVDVSSEKGQLILQMERGSCNKGLIWTEDRIECKINGTTTPAKDDVIVTLAIIRNGGGSGGGHGSSRPDVARDCRYYTTDEAKDAGFDDHDVDFQYVDAQSSLTAKKGSRAAAFGLRQLKRSTVTILCRSRSCILRFTTSAGWNQRVHIRRIGGGLDVTREGRGEGHRQHFSSVVDGGAFQVTAWHNDGSGWVPSDMRTTWFARGHWALADDGGGGNDRDFNDAVVSLTPF